jgi:Domain of unknown function (DUF5667)
MFFGNGLLFCLGNLLLRQFSAIFSLTMLRKIVVSAAVFLFALGILFTSILRTAAVRYETSGVKSSKVLAASDYSITYDLAYPGKILPDSFLWPVKAIRDKLWLFITTDKLKKIELKILFADKRLGGAVTLFERGKNEIALSTLTKAEKYLEEASLDEETLRLNEKELSVEVCTRLANSSLKHYELLMDLENKVPDDMKAMVISIRQTPIKTYERARNALLAKGVTPPINPFNWE